MNWSDHFDFGKRSHPDVGERVSIRTDALASPCSVYCPVFTFQNSKFTAPHIFEQQISLNGHRSCDASGVQLAIHGGEQQSAILESNEIDWHLSIRQIDAHLRSKGYIVDDERKPMVAEFCFDAVSKQQRPEFDGLCVFTRQHIETDHPIS